MSNNDNDTKKVKAILQDNARKNFIQRVLYPESYPVLARPDLGENNYSSHLMSWGDYKGTPIAFPMITHDPVTNKLTQHQDYRAAMDHAMKNNEYIPFTSPEEADWFTKNYKKGMPMMDMENIPKEQIQVPIKSEL